MRESARRSLPGSCGRSRPALAPDRLYRRDGRGCGRRHDRDGGGFSRAGGKLGDFEKRAADYRQRRHELESDPHAPDGVAAFLTRTAVTIGLAAARDVPFAGSLLAPVDAAAAADQANRAREYLARKFSDHRDVRLLLSPADELTPLSSPG